MLFTLQYLIYTKGKLTFELLPALGILMMMPDFYSPLLLIPIQLEVLSHQGKSIKLFQA